MLKLKYLFDNNELALMLLKNWNFDDESLDMFKYFRISSNAIYPFKDQGSVRILRFTPVSEKNLSDIKQELEVMKILLENGFNVPKVVKSKQGNAIETKETPWGKYHAVVFESVGKNTLENIKMTEEIAYQYGRSLGVFHEISKRKIQSSVNRKSVYDIFDLIELKISKETVQLTTLMNELNRIRVGFEKIEKAYETFGLIHYDYEVDNIIHDSKTQNLFAIDFDDCMYGFYGQDIERAINSIESEVDEAIQDIILSNFLKGYEIENGNLEIFQKNREIFKSFAEIYSYFRMKDSLEEKWDNEPKWMNNIRERLNARMNNYIVKLES
ncbi:phosphotransferase enzyme family protein [Fusibacter ferrireducens]|uniref:Phosphotransferase n=1 Tax=Fusibacter ferrireducens TaxID=2785058 RepID=A0ABR9ZM05_9FIRM|nr:phosphotransferase [Fusibacter ferrireducens]MBF4691510.1 phosphotransferase [Fusibacter ferrireducens]